MTQILTPTLLTFDSVGQGQNNGAANTAQVTVKKGQPIHLVVFNKGPNNQFANQPIISGFGITWINIGNKRSSFSNGEWNINEWLGIVEADTVGSININCSGQQQQAIAWGVFQWSGNVFVNPNNLAELINPNNIPTYQNNSTVTGQDLPFGNFLNINNGVFVAFADDGQASFSGVQNSGFMTMFQVNQGYAHLLVSWCPTTKFGFVPPTTNDVVALYTGNNSTGKVAIGFEIIFQPKSGAQII